LACFFFTITSAQVAGCSFPVTSVASTDQSMWLPMPPT